MAVSSSKLRKYPTTSPRPAPRMVATPKPSPKRPSEAPAWSIMTPSAAMRTNASAARSGPKAGPKVGPSSSRVVASCQRATKPPTPSQRRPWDRMSATRFLKPNPSNLYHFFTFKIIVGAIELGETPHLLQSHLHQLVVQEIVCHVLRGKTGKEGAVALHAGHLHLFHHPLGGRTELVRLTGNAGGIPLRVPNGSRPPPHPVCGLVILGHLSPNHLFRERQVAFSLPGKDMGRLLLILPAPALSTDQSVHHFLTPLPPRAKVILVHHRHAAGVVLPDVSGKTYDAGSCQQFTRGVKGLSHDVPVDCSSGERGRHVRRRHDKEVGLFLGQSRLLVLNHRFQSGRAQGHLQDDVVHGIPVGNGDLPPTQVCQTLDGSAPGHLEGLVLHVVPGHYLHRESTRIAQIHGNGEEQVGEIEVVGLEGLG